MLTSVASVKCDHSSCCCHVSFFPFLSAFPAISLGFTILLPLLLHSQLYLWASPSFFFFCIPSCISGLHHPSSSSSVFPAVSLGFIILLLFLLLLLSQLYLWASPSFFFFYVTSCISGLHHPSFSPSEFPAIYLGFTILLLLRSQLYLGFTSLLPLLLHSQLYLWASPSSFIFFFFCIPSCISGLHHPSSSSAFPAVSRGFTILLLLLHSQLYLWASPSFFLFFCVPSCISGLHHPSFSSSSAFPAISLGFTILLLLLCYQLYLWASPSFFLSF